MQSSFVPARNSFSRASIVKIVCACAALTITIALIPAYISSAALPSDVPDYHSTINEFDLESVNGKFDDPKAIEIDSNGNIYVVDNDNYRIQKVDSSVAYVNQWGSLGDNDGEFGTPRDVAVDSSGNIYVVDEDNYRIQKFTNAGVYISQFGEYGSIEIGGSSELGRFNFPTDMAQDSQGNIYVTDTANNRIQKFNSNRVFVEAWGANGADGSQGTGNGEFNFPRSIVIDSSDNVYVGDSGNYRVQKLDTDGNSIAKWGANGGDGSSGSGNGEFSDMRGIALAADGNLLVVDEGNYRVQKLNSTTGAYISQFGTNGSGDGQFEGPTGVAADSLGNIYVADMSQSRIQKFTSSGTYIDQWGANGTNDGEFDGITNVEIDSQDVVYVSDYNNHRIQKFDTNGTFLAKWGSEGTGNGEFNQPESVYVSSNANTVFVVDSENYRIQLFKYEADQPFQDLNGDGIDDAT